MTVYIYIHIYTRKLKGLLVAAEMRYYAWYTRDNSRYSDKSRTTERIYHIKCVRGVENLHSPTFAGIMIRLQRHLTDNTKCQCDEENH
jgi:hypothetical protein